MTIRMLKYRFWSIIHDTLEMLWHWTYYHGVLPNSDPLPIPETVYWYEFPEEKDEA